MSRYKFVLCAALLAALGACGGGEEEPVRVSISDAASPAGDPAGSTFQTLDGAALEISDLEGQKVFLNYWATWCAPCIREIPSIARAESELAGEGFIFLLASDESLEKIRGFVEERGFDGNFIKLNGYFSSHGVQAVPSTTLYDSSGAEVTTWMGAYEWDSPDMLEALRQAQ